VLCAGLPTPHNHGKDLRSRKWLADSRQPIADSSAMNSILRALFDDQLEQLLPELPPQVQQLLADVPLVVEDHPSREVMRQTGVRHRGSLCGLYTGIPLTKRSIQDSGIPSDVIHIFRDGILYESRSPDGTIDPAELRNQIRVTILHELGHHHGLTEADLRELGYG
jgi:predicted Zn-dependent protease with MMP-like domain